MKAENPKCRCPHCDKLFEHDGWLLKHLKNDCPEIWHQPFGSVLRGTRMRSKMKLRQMAERCEMEAVRMGELERGAKAPTQAEAAKIAKVLGLDEIKLKKLAEQETIIADLPISFDRMHLQERIQRCVCGGKTFSMHAHINPGRQPHHWVMKCTDCGKLQKVKATGVR